MKQGHEAIGVGYAQARSPDPHIRALISRALGDAHTVMNVGAGTGNYEPAGRRVMAVEPALEMLGHRPANGHPAVRAVAQALPFFDHAFDAALATLTLHHWNDYPAALSEMRRVAQKQVILLYEPSMTCEFWLIDYFPEALSLPSEVRAPGVEEIRACLEVQTVTPLPIPADCADGFAGAYWARPEAYLDPSIRTGISSLAQLSPEVAARDTSRLDRGPHVRGMGRRLRPPALASRVRPRLPFGGRRLTAGNFLTSCINQLTESS